jgi:TolB protein
MIGLIRRTIPIFLIAGIVALVVILSLTILISAQSPPVSVEKAASPDPVDPGGLVKYSVAFTNSSESTVDLNFVTDTLPADFVFLNMGTVDGCDPVATDDPSGTTESIVWTGPYPIPAGSVRCLAYWVLVTPWVPPAVYQNHLEALLSTGETISDTAPVTVPGASLDGEKDATPEHAYSGDPVDYVVELANNGTTDAVLTVIADTLPETFTFQQMISGPLPAPDVQGNVLVWLGPFTIPAGQDLQFAYEVTAAGTFGHTYSNRVEVNYNGPETAPIEAQVTIMADVSVYLPMLLRQMPPEPPPLEDLLAFDSKPGSDFEIFTIKPDGTRSTNVSNEAGGDVDPDWSPDGARIAWVNYAADGEIFAADADGSNKVNLTDNSKLDREPDWSPDGSKIAFTSFRDDTWQVYVMNADGSSQTRMTYHQCQSYNALWSPDGTRIAYVCGLDEHADIFVMSADGSSYVHLTDNDHADVAPAWSPDSTRLAYVSGKLYDAEIYVVDVDSGVETRLTNNGYADYAPDWSPDGSLIAFSTFMDGSYEIATLNANDGSNVTNLTQTLLGDYVPKWSPEGDQISFVSARDGNKELYVMDADGSAQLRLTFTANDESLHDWQP